MLNLQEFRDDFLSDIHVMASSDIITPTAAFIIQSTEIMKDADVFDDFTESYFETTFGRCKIQIDGFFYDEDDQSAIIMICDFQDKKETGTLTNTDLRRLYNRMKNFVTIVFNGYLEKNCEESSMAYGFANTINREKESIRKIRFFILTDKQISKSIKPIINDSFDGIHSDLSIWDITRLYNYASSKKEKEEIIINFQNYGINGIPAIKAVSNQKEEYESYLSVIPGKVLADMYLEHGSRLLEGNVRSFLSVRGKVNKGIKNTIINEPDMFFAFNNGIAATATGLDLDNTQTGDIITEIEDLQIINGGQTTASLANTYLKEKADLNNIYVPMKLSIVTHERAEKIIPRISRCANSQNKVSEADFFSNHPFHIRMEEISRRLYAPPIDGNQFDTIWYYERIRGQHQQAQMKMTRSQSKYFLEKNPKNQIIKKTDLAKFFMIKMMRPDIVSLGAQKNMRNFAIIIDEKWEKNEKAFNKLFYRDICALAILFKSTEKLVSHQGWYIAVKSYRANIVAYSLAVLFYCIQEKFPEMKLDLKKIWNSQKMDKILTDQLVVTTKEVYDFITCDDRPTENVTEWCKKEACWTQAREVNWTLNDNIQDSLIQKSKIKDDEIRAKRDQKENNEIALELKAFNMGDDYWKKVYDWGYKKIHMTDIERSILRKACRAHESKKILSAKQAKILYKMVDMFIEEGMPESFK